jgi:hypothetical protein
MTFPFPWTENAIEMNNIANFNDGGANFIYIHNNFTIADVYEYVFDTLFLTTITNETNAYLTEKNENILASQTITNEDVMKYFLVTLYMGFIELPDVRTHWKINVFFSKSGFISKMMSRDRFEFLHSAIHFPSEEWTCNYLTEKFKYMWRPYQILVVDECMVLFKGRYLIKINIIY